MTNSRISLTDTPHRDHVADFADKYHALFGELTDLARRRGIGARRFVGGPVYSESPEDFAQECLIRYEKRARVLRLRNVQPGLIRKIANNLLTDIYRAKGRRPMVMQTPLERCVSVCTGQEVPNSRICPELGSTALKIIVSKYLLQSTTQEIATAMSMTQEGVRTSIRRSRKTLRTHHFGTSKAK